jgi:hypothetical protein
LGNSDEDVSPDNRSKKSKAGRKPSNLEPTNKRTAQNRAAQRAFRERKEQYVKDLEERVKLLEKAVSSSTGSDPSPSIVPDENVTLHKENSTLRKRIQDLESENNVLKEFAFNFKFDVGTGLATTPNFSTLSTNAPLISPPASLVNTSSFVFSSDPFNQSQALFPPMNSFGYLDDKSNSWIPTSVTNTLSLPLNNNLTSSLLTTQFQNNMNQTLTTAHIIDMQSLTVLPTANSPNSIAQTIQNNNDELFGTTDISSFIKTEDDQNDVLQCNNNDELIDELCDIFKVGTFTYFHIQNFNVLLIGPSKLFGI